MKKAQVLAESTKGKNFSHIREVYETTDVMETNRRVKGNWEILVAGPSIEEDLDKRVLFILGRSKSE